VKILRAIGIEPITKSTLLPAFGPVTLAIGTFITALCIAKALFAKVIRHGGSCPYSRLGWGGSLFLICLMRGFPGGFLTVANLSSMGI
jgi:hypothetical protein